MCRFKPTQLAHGPCHVTGFHPQLYGGSLRLTFACLGKLEIQMQWEPYQPHSQVRQTAGEASHVTLFFFLLNIVIICHIWSNQHPFSPPPRPPPPYPASDTAIMANDRNQMVSVRQRQSSRGLFSPEVVDLVVPPLKFGGYAGKLLHASSHTPYWHQAGTVGVLAGVGGSIFQEANPIIWGTVSGFQWFTLGTSFWCKLSLKPYIYHRTDLSSHQEYYC